MNTVCSIERPTLAEVEKEAKEALGYTSCFELRLDALAPEELENLARLAVEGTWIYTFRKKEQGGCRPIEEEERLSLLRRALRCRPAYCDIETDTAGLEDLFAEFPDIRWIGSYHNFETMPPLDPLFASMQRSGFYAYKIAVRVSSTERLLALFSWKQRKKERLSVLGLGPFGKAGRILSRSLGNLFHYTGLQERKEPLFRPSLKTLFSQFGYGRLASGTQHFALLGDPVEQSPGDLFHNRWFQAKGQNRLYGKLPVGKEELARAFPLLKQLSFAGFSVTMPLKEAIVSLLDRLTPEAAAIGRVNTVFLSEGLWWGANTDGAGALKALEAVFAERSFSGRTFSFLGGGATAQAIAYEARKKGAETLFFTRSSKSHPFRAAWGMAHDILVSAIPLSAQEEIGEAGFRGLSANLALDVAYAEQAPPFTSALQKVCPTVSGIAMWREQALLQQHLWDCFCSHSV